MKNVGDDFQRLTKYIRGKMSGGYLDWSRKPGVYKHYANSKRVELPFPVEAVTLSFDEAVRKRRSVRRFSGEPLSLKQLGYLLWVSTGVQRVENGYAFRNAPSAGALYPVETYLFAKKVDGLKAGLYHYDVESHFLEELKVEDLSFSLSRAGLGQDMFANAIVVFIWSGFFARSKWKYGQRAYRYVYLDCGHIAQNLALGACSIGLVSCQIGAFYDDEVNEIVGLDGEEESVLYLSVVGRAT